MKSPPRDSVAAMGFENKFNLDYAAFATVDQTPFEILSAMFRRGKSDTQIGAYFDRRPQAARKWRIWWQELQED